MALAGTIHQEYLAVCSEQYHTGSQHIERDAEPGSFGFQLEELEMEFEGALDVERAT